MLSCPVLPSTLYGYVKDTIYMLARCNESKILYCDRHVHCTLVGIVMGQPGKAAGPWTVTCASQPHAGRLDPMFANV